MQTMVYPVKDLVFTQLVQKKKITQSACHRAIKYNRLEEQTKQTKKRLESWYFLLQMSSVGGLFHEQSLGA